MLRAVTFDLWQTLITEDAELEAARRAFRNKETARILVGHGIEASPEMLDAAHDGVIARMHPFWSSNLDVSVIEQAKIYLEAALGGPVEKRVPPQALLEIARHYGEAALHFPPTAVPGALRVIQDAQKRGLMLALICNTGRTPGKVLRELLHILQFDHCFHAMYFSDETRVRKPARDVFEKALARFAVAPSDALHVGDRLDADVAGAKGAGMIAVHLDLGDTRFGLGSGPDADFTIGDISELSPILEKIAPPPGQTRKISNLGETRHD